MDGYRCVSVCQFPIEVQLSRLGLGWVCQMLQAAAGYGTNIVLSSNHKTKTPRHLIKTTRSKRPIANAKLYTFEISPILKCSLPLHQIFKCIIDLNMFKRLMLINALSI